MRGPNENEARVLSSNQSSSDASNTIFLHKGETSSYIIPSYDSNSTEIVFNGFQSTSTSSRLSSRQELRFLYDEDSLNKHEGDAAGESCADVVANSIFRGGSLMKRADPFLEHLPLP